MTGRLLIVEDERVVAFHLKVQLEGVGYGVVGMPATGEHAVQLALQHRPDLILMDIHLKGDVDGIEAARRIGDAIAIPVIFLTAYVEDETLDRARAVRPYGYLVKPYEVRELHATVQMALERRHAELARERGHQRLQLALDAAALGVWEWDTASGHVMTSGHLDSIFGSTVESMEAGLDAFLNRVHPDDQARIAALLEAGVQTEQPINALFRYLRSDASEACLEVHAKAYPGRESNRPRIIGVIKDVTERHVMEERLRQAGVVFETTAEAICILDRNHLIVSVNPAFGRMTGYAAVEVIGRNPDDLLHARRHGDQFYSRLLGTEGGHWQGESFCCHRNGRVFPIWENVNVVRDSHKAVTHYVLTFADISAIRHAQSELNRLAHHDALTGLPNRLLFNDRIDNALAQAARELQRFALLFLDLDGFKVINDTLGHSSGDLLLQTVGARIKARLRSSDTAARLGGDEFVVLLEQIGQREDAGRIAQLLLEAITAPIDLPSERVTVTASIGIAIFPENGPDRQALLKAADTAMYSAKSKGRNRTCFYSEDLAVRAAERMRVEQGLRRALAEGELLLHYQPLVKLEDGSLSGFEALVRWQPLGQIVTTPGRFIPIAEETGLIGPMGRWILAHACQEFAAAAEGHGKALRLSVNVSARQFLLDPFDVMLAEVLEETGFPPEQLELEITESALQVVEHSRGLLSKIKSLGVSIAVDDFGTGYSSLSVLKHLPIDRLKIDRSFVQDMPEDSSDVAIVEAIAAMSRTLGLRMVAEGIETSTQLDVLRRLGCEEGQGFLFSAPLPLTELGRYCVPGAGFRTDQVLETG